MNRDGPRIVCGADNGVFVWDVVQQVALAGPLYGSEDAQSVALGAYQSRIAVGHRNGDISIYDADTFRPASRCLRGHTSVVTFVAFCRSDSRLLSGSEDGAVRYWNCGEGVLQSAADDATHESHRSHIPGRQITISANCKVVPLERYRSIALYNAEISDTVGELATNGFVKHFCISDDGAYVGVIDEYSVVVWNIGYPACPRQVFTSLYNFSYRVSAVFSADSKRLAAYLDNGAILIWNVANGGGIQQIRSRAYQDMTASELRIVAFPPDSDAVESGELESRSNDCPLYAHDGEFYLRTATSNMKIMSLPGMWTRKGDWLFDRLRGRLWRRKIGGFLFIAQLENCPEVVERCSSPRKSC